jgi:hypothetical protein
LNGSVSGGREQRLFEPVVKGKPLPLGDQRVNLFVDFSPVDLHLRRQKFQLLIGEVEVSKNLAAAVRSASDLALDEHETTAAYQPCVVEAVRVDSSISVVTLDRGD